MRERKVWRPSWFWRRTARTATGLLLVVALLAPAVEAHGGSLVYKGASGPYRVQAFALLSDGWLDYSIHLQDARLGLPVTDATVLVRGLGADGSLTTWKAIWTGSVYETLEEVGDASLWIIQVEIESPLGQTTVNHELDLRSNNGVWAVGVVVGIFIVILVAHAVVGHRRLRQRYEVLKD